MNNIEFNSHKQHRGFTVLEMMIVAVVIVILAMMLVPVLKASKERVKAVQCMSNLHGLYVMWTLKRADDSKILVSTDTTYGVNTIRMRDSEWPVGYLSLAKSVGADTNLFVCPSDPKPFRSPVLFITQHTGGAYAGARVGSFALEEPCIEYPWNKTIKDVPNPRQIVRKSAGIGRYNTWDILINSNNTATLTLVSGGYYDNNGLAALWDVTRTNRVAPSVGTDHLYTGSVETNYFAKDNNQYIVPTMASSYGYNYVDVNTYTNGCSPSRESPIRVLGWPDDAKRTVLLMDYPVSHVRCALCYAYQDIYPLGMCSYCGTNSAVSPKNPPGPADNWDADAMGPLIGRHRGKCNVVFQDGSAGTYKPAEIDPRVYMWQFKGIAGTNTAIINRFWRSTHREGHDVNHKLISPSGQLY
jgi:prepilin-type N-terminal cleavage/methylation domain-containing protein/prepilin-type processing-associated H-X9-DG protein